MTNAHRTADPVQPPTARHTAADVLAAGLRWLYETAQPDDAHAQHHGEQLTADNNRRYVFVPVGAGKRPVVVVDVAKIEYTLDADGYQVPANPLEPDELERLAEEIRALGYEVDHSWNGHPSTTGSVGLVQEAHPAQVAAVERYMRGCQVHPDRRVFCDCESWRAGFRRVVRPVVAPAAEGSAA